MVKIEEDYLERIYCRDCRRAEECLEDDDYCCPALERLKDIVKWI